MFFRINDIPFIVIIAFGVLLPELYIRMHWSLRKLMTIRLITLVATCLLATWVELLLSPGDFGVIFTRAFIFIGVSRMIMLSSHQVTDQQAEKKEK